MRLVKTKADLKGLQLGEEWEFDGWPANLGGDASPEEKAAHAEQGSKAHALFLELSSYAEDLMAIEAEKEGGDGAELEQSMEEPDVADNLINTDALGPMAQRISKTAQYALAIGVGVLAFIGVYAVLTNWFGVEPDAGASLTGVAGGFLVLALWFVVRKDNKEAKASGDKLLITSETSLDILNTGLGFAGVVVIGALIGASVGILVAAGLATQIAYWAGRRVWKNVS